MHSQGLTTEILMATQGCGGGVSKGCFFIEKSIFGFPHEKKTVMRIELLECFSPLSCMLNDNVSLGYLLRCLVWGKHSTFLLHKT